MIAWDPQWWLEKHLQASSSDWIFLETKKLKPRRQADTKQPYTAKYTHLIHSKAQGPRQDDKTVSFW